MATTDPPPDAASLDQSTKAAQQAGAALGQLADMGQKAQTMFGNFVDSLKATKDAMKQNGEATNEQAAALAGLSVVLLGTREAYTNLTNIDTTGLNTFGKQITDLEKIIQNSPAAKLLKSGYDAAIETAKEAGKAILDVAARKTKIDADTLAAKTKYDKGMTDLTGPLDAAKAMAASADNAVRLQNAFLQLSAQTGNLGNVFKVAGPTLLNINSLLKEQQAMISGASQASGLGADVVENYYSQLGSVPGALEAIVKTGNNAGETTNMLNATMQLAAGSGRKYSDIVSDLSVAFKNYPKEGSDALLFSARIGELTNNLGLNLSDVRDALGATAAQFKMYGNSAEGATDMMNEYVQSLKAAGISGNAALEIFSGLTGGIRGMNLAQKSMLSAQTGGAGGLRGAFQIEDMLSDKSGEGIKKVMDKVRQQIMQQTGPIVDVHEAAGSEAAAQRAARQNAILKQGALGSFAKDDATAEKIMAAFKSGKPLKFEDLKADTVQKTTEAGVAIQKQTYTEAARIRALIESAQGLASVTNLGTMERATAAGTGELIASGDTDAQSKYRESLALNMQRGLDQSKDASGRFVSNDNNGIGAGTDRGGQMAFQSLTAFKSTFDQISGAVQSSLDEGARIGSGLTGGAGSTAVKARFTSAGTPASAGTAAHPIMHTAPATPDHINLDVNITGICIDCGQKMAGSTQKHSVSTGTRVLK